MHDAGSWRVTASLGQQSWVGSGVERDAILSAAVDMARKKDPTLPAVMAGNYYSGDVTTFDGKAHKLVATKVGGTWRAHTSVDGQFIRGAGAKSLDRAIKYFQLRYKMQFGPAKA